MLFEKLDKAGIVFVAHLFHDILDGQAGLCQHLFGQGDALLDQQLAESQAGLFFENFFATSVWRISRLLFATKISRTG